MSLLILGSIAYDSVKTPFGESGRVLGGSGVYSSVAASFFTDVSLIGVIGKDFLDEDINFLKSKNINLDNVEIKDGETFFWQGEYKDMNEAITISTKLNVFTDYSPSLKENICFDYLFLSNIAPSMQIELFNQVNAKFVAIDTMNLWIDVASEDLKKIVANADILFVNELEIKKFANNNNLFEAANFIKKELDLKYLVVKRGSSGLLFFYDEKVLLIPSYPCNLVKDPTGAGDSFAGGFMGYLSSRNCINEDVLKKALLFGTVMASINIEDYSLNRMRNISFEEINKRFNFFCEIIGL